VWHLAANPDIRKGTESTMVDLEQNTIATYNVLESARRTDIKTFVFSSTSTIYGRARKFPTPEDYGPCLPISLYGASKLAAEAIIQAYGEYFGIRSYVFRFVSWIGERYSHGVIFDFINKLRAKPGELEILGDGSQKKSYLHVEDGIRGIFLALEKMTDLKNVINLGHVEYMNVKNLAEIVCEELGLSDVVYRYTGGTRGWLGDSPFVHLDISKLQSIGFQPRISIEDGVRRTVRYLARNPWILASRRS